MKYKIILVKIKIKIIIWIIKGRFQIINVTFHLKKLDTNKHKASKRKEIIKIWLYINTMKTKIQQRISNQNLVL